MKPALLLDRDGVINIDTGYVSRAVDIQFRKGIFDIMRGFKMLGHLLVVVTNQSGIGRGLFTEQEFRDVTAYMVGYCAGKGAQIDRVYHCPHAPDDECQCRKPLPGMILQAARELDIDLERSTLIGDKQTDIDAGRAAGVGHLILWR